MANIADIINPSPCLACGEIRPILKGNCCNPCHEKFKMNRGKYGKAKHRLTPNGLYCLGCEKVVKVNYPYQSIDAADCANKYIKTYCSNTCAVKGRDLSRRTTSGPKPKIVKPQYKSRPEKAFTGKLVFDTSCKYKIAYIDWSARTLC